MLTRELLHTLEAAMASSRPVFHRSLEPGASEPELDAIRAEIGVLPDDAALWFRWHAGSDEGFIPGTPWGLITIEEAAREVRFVRSHAGSAVLAATAFVPLLTGRDGGLMYYVAASAQPAVVVEYHRGECVKTTPFHQWLEWLIRTWQAESAVLRVAWVRLQRSPMGWLEIHLPAKSRSRLRTLLRSLPFEIDEGLLAGPTVRVVNGSTPGWVPGPDSKRGLEITLTPDGATELAASLAETARATVRIPGLDDLRLALVKR